MHEQIGFEVATHFDAGTAVTPATSPPCARSGRSCSTWEGLAEERAAGDLRPLHRLQYRDLAGGTAILMALEGVFCGDEAARRSNVIPLNQAFGRLEQE
jgi:hypothetical protein